MNEKHLHTTDLEAEIARLREELDEANGIIDAIREGAVDALVLNKDGEPHIYSMESADYTYRVLIEKFGEGALSISDDGLVLYCNDYFAKLVGVESSRIVGTFFHRYVVDPEIFDQLRVGLKNGPSKGQILIKAIDRTIPVYLSLSDLSPRVHAIGAVVTDLSEKIKQEDALRESQQKLENKVNELNSTNLSLEQFIHVISHDLKEPLRKIVTYTDYLNVNASGALADKERKSLNVINSSAMRLNSLVDDLVKYAFSAIATETDPVDLNRVLKDVVDDLELIMKEKNGTIIWNALPTITGSKVQMRQLFSNLLSNALKYSRFDIPPYITVDAAPADAGVVISVRDNGIGMNRKHIGKIFTIFQRLHMRDEYSGNGIGLAICKKIMENHGGKITVVSEENSGSTFELYFPNNEI